MAREFRLRPSPNIGEAPSEGNYSLDRRRFMRYSFNTAAGLITMASFGSIGFASLLMGTTDGAGGSNTISYWVPKGQENNVWYGSKHLEAMKKSDFEGESANSATGMSGAQGVWGGMPCSSMEKSSTGFAKTTFHAFPVWCSFGAATNCVGIMIVDFSQTLFPAGS